MFGNETFLEILLLVVRNINFQKRVPSAAFQRCSHQDSRCSIKFLLKDGWRREGRTDGQSSNLCGTITVCAWTEEHSLFFLLFFFQVPSDWELGTSCLVVSKTNYHLHPINVS